jgi:hypothetical protein
MASRIVVIATAVVLGLAGCGGSDESGTTDDPGEIVFDLSPQGTTGVAGARATLIYESRDRTTIVVDGLDEGEPAGGGANPVWLRNGSCDDLGQIVSELDPLRGSSSETTVRVGLPALLNGEYAIAVGLPDGKNQEVACGDVPDEATQSSSG